MGGGRAPGFPALGPRDVSLNNKLGALPDVVGDIAAAPFRSGSFGSVYFENMPFPAFTGANSGALHEAARVLRPGGQLAITTGNWAPVGQIRNVLTAAGFTNIRVSTGSFIRITARLGGR